MASLYLNSFHPLTISKAGLIASERYALPPFIDGSIRREPDFDHPQPVITCLCRGERFAPRLSAGDHVVYQTVKPRPGSAFAHRRLVAVLKVERLFNTHELAADWFRDRGMALPNNLMVAGNISHPIEHTHGRNKEKVEDPERWRRRWDAGYWRRARQCGRVVGCTPVFIETGWDAPIITDEVLISVFGQVPATLNPKRQDLSLLPELLSRLGIPGPPSSP